MCSITTSAVFAQTRSSGDGFFEDVDLGNLGLLDESSGLFQADMPVRGLDEWDVGDDAVFSGVDFDNETPGREKGRNVSDVR